MSKENNIIRQSLLKSIPNTPTPNHVVWQAYIGLDLNLANWATIPGSLVIDSRLVKLTNTLIGDDWSDYYPNILITVRKNGTVSLERTAHSWPGIISPA